MKAVINNQANISTIDTCTITTVGFTVSCGSGIRGWSITSNLSQGENEI